MKFLLMMVMISSAAFAGDLDLMTVMKDPTKCPALKITEEQKTEIKAMMKRAHDEMTQYRPMVAMAQAAVDLAYLTPTAPRESAEAALMALELAKMPIKDMMNQVHRDVEFDVFSGAQRAALQTCKIQARQGH
jgi:hypothetical protein